MFLNWRWEDKLGSVVLVETHNGVTKRFKIELYTCNGLFVGCYHYKNEQGRKVYDLVTFACDAEHFKRCLGLVKGYESTFDKPYGYFTRWKLNAYYREAWTMARLLVKAGFNVNIFTKAPKEKEDAKDCRL